MSYSDRKDYGRGRKSQWRGPTPEAPPEHLDFEPEEYEQIDRRVRIAVKTVVDKLPTPTRKRYAQVEYQRQAMETQEAMIAAGIEREAITAWLNEFARGSQTGRAWSVVVDTLQQVQRMLTEHGAPLLNIALTRCLYAKKPSACTSPYLKAVLRNLSQSATPQPAQPGDPWEGILRVLRQRINERSYNTWIRPLRPGRITADGYMQIICPTDVHVSWLTEHYTTILSQAYAQVFGREPAQVAILEGGE